MSSDQLLEVKDLSVTLLSESASIRPVDRVSFSLGTGEIMGLVGESGSGKTMACRTIAGLLPEATSVSVQGDVNVAGEVVDLAARGRRHDTGIAMIFQNPSTYLDPLMPVWLQIAEPLLFNEGMARGRARDESLALMKKVGIPDVARNANVYPHQLSGGMKQRVVIAAALACRPRLLIADEPTTALDVTVQMQILHLLLQLRRESGLSIILVSHDLGVISAICDSVHVMYCGKIVEQGNRQAVLASPAHPYTRALLRSSPAWDGDAEELQSIPGQLPPLHALPSGCRFRPRCEFAVSDCERHEPDLCEVSPGHRAACLRAEEVVSLS